MSTIRRPAGLVVTVAIGAALVGPVPAWAEEDALTILAGTGRPGTTGDGGPATAALLNHPAGVAVAADGTVYISDGGNHRVRAVATDGTISTVAGTGRPGRPGTEVPDGTPGTDVDLLLPQHLAVGPDGTLYIADPGLARVFALAPNGRMSVVAGTGRPGPPDDGGLARGTAFNQIGGLAVGPDNTVYVGDLGGHRVRAVTPDNRVRTVAGNGGTRLVAAGGAATSVPVPNPASLAVDRQGTLWIASGLVVHRVSNGQISTVILPDQPGGDRWALSESPSWPPSEPPMNNVPAVSVAGGDVYVLDQSARAVLRLGDGDALERVASLDSATGPLTGPITVTASGVGYLVDNADHRVYSFRLAPPTAADPGPGSTPWWPLAAAAVAFVVLAGGGFLVRVLRRRAR